MERLTPTWDWQFEVEKNSFNSRSTKHKYKSSDKASDLPKRVTVDRLSRYFKECLNEVKKIKQLDNDFVVTLRAYKPEGETKGRRTFMSTSLRLSLTVLLMALSQSLQLVVKILKRFYQVKTLKEKTSHSPAESAEMMFSSRMLLVSSLQGRPTMLLIFIV